MLVLTAGCSRAPQHVVHRIAVLPTDVLIADASSDWMRVALPIALQTDLASSPSGIVFNAESESSAYAGQADELLHTVIESRSGRFGLSAVLTDISTQRTVRVIDVSGAASRGAIPLVDEIARRVDVRAKRFPTRSDAALRAFAAVAETPDLQRRIALLNTATSIDPSFGLAQVARLEAAAQTGVLDLKSLISEGQRTSGSFDSVDRARFNALVSRLTHAQLPKQEEAIAALARLLPNDPDVSAALGSLQVLAGNFGPGLRLLGRATELNPASVGLLRQSAEAFVRSRRFGEAEKMLAPLAERNPTLLPQLAAVILLNGDPARASKVFEQFVALRGPSDPIAVLLRARWMAIGGQLNGAVALLQTASTTDPDFHSAAMGQIAVWQLSMGSRTEAKRNMSRPGNSPTAGIAAILTAASDKSSAQWQAQVEASPFGANEPVKDLLLAFGFFLQADYANSAPAWEKIVGRSGNTDLPARAMLAASLDRAGRQVDARKVVVEPFVPDLSDLYAAVSFGEMRRLLGLRGQ